MILTLRCSLIFQSCPVITVSFVQMLIDEQDEEQDDDLSSRNNKGGGSSATPDSANEGDKEGVSEAKHRR